MAIAWVANSSVVTQTGSTTLAVTYSSTGGNTLVAYISGFNSGNTPGSVTQVTDSTGTNAWTVIPGSGGFVSAFSYYGYTAVAFCVGAAAVTSVTAHFSSAPAVQSYLQVTEFSGVPGGFGAIAVSAPAFAYTGTVSSFTPAGITMPTAPAIAVCVTAGDGPWTSVSPGNIVLSSQAAWEIFTATANVAYAFSGSNGDVGAITMAIGFPPPARGRSVRAPAGAARAAGRLYANSVQQVP